MVLPPDYALSLLPGDVLLYSGTGPLSRYIRWRTSSRFSHCEVFDGDGHTVASRDGIGVGRYPLRTSQLSLVLRLHDSVPFDLRAARAWADTVMGQGYDFWGLTSFTIAEWQGRENQKQFCSEFGARYFRHGIAGALGIDDGDRKALHAVGRDPWRGKNADGIPPQGFDDSPFFIERF